jgi:hypothetical protein
MNITSGFFLPLPKLKPQPNFEKNFLLLNLYGVKKTSTKLQHSTDQPYTQPNIDLPSQSELN